MASVQGQVIFATPAGGAAAGWSLPSPFESSGYGSPGKDAWSTYLDKDGVSCWAFEYFGSGFARFNHVTGGMMFCGNTFDTQSNYTSFDNFGDSSVPWAQSDDAHYFTVAGGNAPIASPVKFYKFHVGASSGDWGSPYLTTDASLDISAIEAADGGVEGGIAWARSGGTGYAAFNVNDHAGNIRAVIINTDTMALVGKYTVAAGTGLFGDPFVDDSGDFWWMNSNLGGGDYGCNLIKWHPADGASGGTLNVTLHYVSAATLGFGNPGPVVCRYAGSGVAFIGQYTFPGSGATGFPGPCALIELSTFTRTAFKADDGTFFLIGGDLDGCENALACPPGTDGSLVIPAPYPGTRPTGYAGVVNLIDPATLAVRQSVDVTSLINASSVADKPGDQVNSAGANQEFASLQFIGATGGGPPSSQVVKIGHGLNQLSVYPPLGSSGGGGTGKLIVTYAFEGSPAYIINL